MQMIKANANRCLNGRRARRGKQLCALAAVGLGVGLPGTAAHADNLTFLSNVNAFNNGVTDGSEADGSGTWDTVTPNWYDNTSGTGPVVWPNTFTSVADFGDPANTSTPAFAQYTVTVQPAGVNAGGIEFSYSGFNVSGGPVNFNTTNGVITTDNAGVSGLISSTLTGTGGITVAGGGSVVLAGANTFTGGVNISGGALSLSTINNAGTAGPLGMDTGTLSAINFTGQGSEFAYTGGSTTTARAFNFANNDDYVDVANASTILTVTGPVTAGSVGNNSFYKVGPGTLVLTNNTVQLSANQNVFLGDGGLVLTGSGTNALITAPNAGIGSLFIGNQNFSPAATDTVAFMNVSGGSTLSVEHLFIGEGNNNGVNNVAVLNVMGAGTTFIAEDSSGLGEGGTGFSNVGTGIMNISGGATFFSANSDFRIAETIGTVGTVNLTGASTLNISNGTLYVGSGNNSIGTFNQTGGTVNTGGYLVAGASPGSVGTYTMTGGVVNTTFQLTGFGGNNGNALGIYNQAAGTINVSVETFLGYDTGSAGIYYLGNGSAGSATLSTYGLTTGSGTGTVYFNGGILQSAPGNGGGLVFNGGTALTAVVMAGGLIVDSNGTDVSVDVPLQASTTSTGGGLTKIGAGSITLSQTNTYTGPTVVSAGTLFVDGSTPSTGIVRVASGGTLAGNGSVGSVIVAGTISGTALDVDNTGATFVSTLTTGPETWNGSGAYSVLLGNSSSNSKLIMSGLTIQATAGSPFVIAPTGTGNSSLGAVYVIATDTTATTNPYAAAIAAQALILSPNTVPPTDGSTFALASAADGGGGYDLLLEDVATPEPTSLALLALAAAPLTLGRRRRCQGASLSV